MSASMSDSLSGSRDQAPSLGRGLVLPLGGLVLVGLLLAAWLLPGKSVEPLPSATTAAEIDTEDAPEPDEPEPSPDDPDGVLEVLPTVTYEVYLARDPFDPVVPEDLPEAEAPADPNDTIEPVDPSDPAAPDDPDAPVDPRDPRDPRDPVGPGDPADPDDPDRCVGDEEVVCNGHVVSLVDLTEVEGDRVAVIQVDTTVYEVRTGETFAERFRLLEIGADRVRVLFGDQDFSLRLDERVLK